MVLNSGDVGYGFDQGKSTIFWENIFGRTFSIRIEDKGNIQSKTAPPQKLSLAKSLKRRLWTKNLLMEKVGGGAKLLC